MDNLSIGSTWGIWDLQVQTILDDGYIQLSTYYKDLKASDPTKWELYVDLVGGEENALLFDSKKYFNDTKIPENERCYNYSRNLFSFLKVYKPNLSLVGFTDHNYYHDTLIDSLHKYSKNAQCKSLCGVEINAGGIHMLVFFDSPPYQKNTFSEGIKFFLANIGVNNPKEGDKLTVSTKSVNEIIPIVHAQNGIYVFPHCNSSNGLFTERNTSDRTALANIFNANDFIFLQGPSKENVDKVQVLIERKKAELFSSHLFSIASDSRKLLDIGKADSQGNYFWLKGKPNFRAFKHITVEKERAFIGNEPDLKRRVREHSTKFIKALSIRQIPGKSIPDQWFQDFNLELNSGLVAIIGNKGSGKSALTDIIGICSNTHQKPKCFSFLTPQKFRKPRPYNLSENFEATVTWHDGSIFTKKLSEDPDYLQVSKVKYLPQNFLESVCNDIEGEIFENELKNVIYSHTPYEKRLDKESLDELINYKSDLLINEIRDIKSLIQRLNSQIIELENRSSLEYKVALDSKLREKENELEAHERNFPIAPEDDGLTLNNQELVASLNGLRNNIVELEEKVKISESKKKDLTIQLAELNSILAYFKYINDQIKQLTLSSEEHIMMLGKYGLDVRQIFSYSINEASIVELISNIERDLQVESDKTDPLKEGNILFQIESLNRQLKLGEIDLDRPAKLQQKFLDDQKQWVRTKELIIGSIEIEGTILYYKNQIEYLNDQLSIDIEQKYSERELKLKELLAKKNELVDIRKELFYPVSKFIEDYKELSARYNVKIDVNLELKSFDSKFLSFINQSKIGTYQGSDEGGKKLKSYIEDSQFESIEDILQFANGIIDSLKFDKRNDKINKVEIKNQLSKNFEVQDLYDYIYGFEYLQPVYNLKLGEKQLQELSPGERGALLLIFYLILDNDDIPLIIDQPEENLDNESVYHILVHFIKKVKENRQIIMVTHNPNLAIVCDADQIIHMAIEKNNGNKVTFKSGAIEESIINKSVIDVLEGTIPAFNNRNLKYFTKELIFN